MTQVFCFEGLDASGKATQVKLFKQKMKEEGGSCSVIRFPFYEKPTGQFIKSFLRGEVEVSNPYARFLAYAMDRYEATPETREATKKEKNIVYDRFTLSNLAYQGALLPEHEREEFMQWGLRVEQKLVQPDLTFFMDLPAEASSLLSDLRCGETSIPKDENEANLQYLKNVYKVYDSLCSSLENVIRVRCLTHTFLESPKTLKELSQEFSTLDERIAYVVRSPENIHEEVMNLSGL